MQIKWFRKKSDNQEIAVVSIGDAKTDKQAMPAQVAEDSAQSIAQVRNLNSYLDQAFQDCMDSGGFDNLAGKGKPITVQDGDPLNSMLKNANVLPPWLELQHEIRTRIEKLIKRIELGQSESVTDEEIAAINKQIVRYNISVPTPILQKGRIFKDTIRDQLERWQ
ncbi:DUF1992 domain-containing protein [Paenibacillus sp. HJGM_3]|uniref:DnaJ family domain-containing protein n=1 Tax=Paenibacillus sp. HJGM_3 TaxID=3379816 RepID=UPI0038593335